MKKRDVRAAGVPIGASNAYNILEQNTRASACTRPFITMNHYTFWGHVHHLVCPGSRFAARAFRLRTRRKWVASTGIYCMLAWPLHFSVSLL